MTERGFGRVEKRRLSTLVLVKHNIALAGIQGFWYVQLNFWPIANFFILQNLSWIRIDSDFADQGSNDTTCCQDSTRALA
jgi:hypothetical protein